ncbi:MAG: hypothetical protein NXH75_10315, partial [Halobacteriovoraceae bacterium]|nr:hypothetical protein [Halobacteriovoraceae bacterium]
GHSKEQAQKDHLDLTQVFRELESLNVQLWLDFKDSNPKNSFKFAFYLRKILKNTSSSIPLFVETKDPITLAALSLARIPTSFGFGPRKNVPNGVYKNLYKILSCYFKPVFLSSTPINKSQINTLLPKKEKVIFTLNDTEMIKSYCRTPKIKIILTDLPYERIQTACN